MQHRWLTLWCHSENITALFWQSNLHSHCSYRFCTRAKASYRWVWVKLWHTQKGSTLLSRQENLIWHNLYVTGYGRTIGALGNVTFRAQTRLDNWGIVKAGHLSPVSKSFPQNAHPIGLTKEHGGEGQERQCKHWRERRFIWQIMRLLKGGSGLRALGGDWRTRWWCLGKTGLTGVYVGAEALSCELVLYEPSSSVPLLSSRLSPADTPIGGLCTVTEAWGRMEELVSSPSQNDLPGTSETRKIEIVKIGTCSSSAPNMEEYGLLGKRILDWNKVHF